MIIKVVVNSMAEVLSRTVTAYIWDILSCIVIKVEVCLTGFREGKPEFTDEILPSHPFE